MTLFVSNFLFAVEESDLRALFSEYGPVERVKIVCDHGSGHSRGFGFVDMARREDGERAIEALHGGEWDGRVLTVNEARTAQQKPRSESRSPGRPR